MKNTASAARSSHEQWQVLPHGPIEKLTENLWRVEGDLPHFSMRRVMTVVRLSDGRLLIHSAIAMDAASMQQLEAWGTPAFLLIPHSRHRLDAPRFKERYPSLRVLVPPAVLAKARAVVNVDGTYADLPSDLALRLEVIDGTGGAEGALIVHSSDGVSVVLNEVVFDLQPPKSALARAALRFVGFGPGARVTPIVKLELVKDKAQLKAHLERLAGTPNLVRLIVSHNRMSEGPAAAAALRSAAASV
ncbi:MAG: hypothetical protein ABJB12_18080 [Pseudomonadota bacterium]